MYRIFAKLSGLDRLIERYPCSNKPQGQESHWQTVMVGSVVYRRCVSVISSPEGFYLHVKPILSSFAPALIPWSEFRRTDKAFLHWRDARRLVVGDPSVASITVYGRVLDDMRPFLPTLFVNGL